MQTVTAPAMLDEGVKRRKLTVSELYALVDAGLIAPEDRVEMIDGELYVMTPPSSHHAAVVKYLSKMLEQAYGDKALVSTQDPVYFSEHDFALPDLAVLKHRDDFYRGAHPTPADVLWLVEVSKTTLGYDKTKKLALYARLNIAEVWLVNLQEGAVEVCRQPTSAGYGEVLARGVGEAALPLAFPEKEVVVLPEALR
jgi:Uma2 family endonuclease